MAGVGGACVRGSARTCKLGNDRRVEFQKASIRFVRLSVRPSAWNNSAPTGRILTKLDI